MELNRAFSKKIRNRRQKFWQDGLKDIYILPDPLSIPKLIEIAHWQRFMSDKYNSRRFVEELNIKTPALYWVGTNIKDLPWKSLPENYVIRTSRDWDSKGVFVIRNGMNLLKSEQASIQDINKYLEKSLEKRPCSCVLVEEFLPTENNEFRLHIDYKVYIFNGKVACIQEIQRNTKQNTHVFYDSDWNKLPQLNYNFPNGKDNLPPKCLDEMLKDARTISKIFKSFVRLDFYSTPRGSVFGEFTGTPATGLYFNGRGSKLLNSYWEKYCPGMI
ncbi:ATP-grasp fold amidoligase family protein [Pleomorphovibrio marinus]|uniref:ATP-grasp fold amidoligase family protein n=1 Tax=Pleomorphovibrio marinus TaxID=2164132 RepID=UPI00130043DD|nr:ATP-grasp fold amidoligase family protein [Pleomorphovibrio marinus]